MTKKKDKKTKRLKGLRRPRKKIGMEINLMLFFDFTKPTKLNSFQKFRNLPPVSSSSSWDAYTAALLVLNSHSTLGEKFFRSSNDSTRTTQVVLKDFSTAVVFRFECFGRMSPLLIHRTKVYTPCAHSHTLSLRFLFPCTNDDWRRNSMASSRSSRGAPVAVVRFMLWGRLCFRFHYIYCRCLGKKAHISTRLEADAVFKRLGEFWVQTPNDSRELACSRACMHAHIYTHTGMHACTHTHTHTHVHMHARTHVCTHSIYSLGQWNWVADVID